LQTKKYSFENIRNLSKSYSIILAINNPNSSEYGIKSCSAFNDLEFFKFGINLLDIPVCHSKVCEIFKI